MAIDALAAFEATWLGRLSASTRTAFQYAPLENGAGIHTKTADAFVETLGLKPIGFNWELLDAAAGPSEPRSALGQIQQAIANDISNPAREWLGDQTASQCAHDFVAAFAPANRTIISNRYDGLWNPISGMPVEWGFVGFDHHCIALLLFAAD